MELKFEVNIQAALEVMQEAASWLSENNHSTWNVESLIRFAESNCFHVGLINHTPVIAAILKKDQEALNIYALSVARSFAGQGFPREFLKYTDDVARMNKCSYLKLETDCLLIGLYEDLDFEVTRIVHDDASETVFFQRWVSRN